MESGQGFKSGDVGKQSGKHGGKQSNTHFKEVGKGEIDSAALLKGSKKAGNIGMIDDIIATLYE